MSGRERSNNSRFPEESLIIILIHGRPEAEWSNCLFHFRQGKLCLTAKMMHKQGKGFSSFVNGKYKEVRKESGKPHHFYAAFYNI
jgi:hypothetical protein